MDMESDHRVTTTASEDHNNEQDYSELQHQQEKINEILKTRISTHPLFELLVQAHLDCLKVGEIPNMEKDQKVDQKQAMNKQNLGNLSDTELDLFMEAYCLALRKLKEALEEPQEKSMAFINNMHSQLKELTITSFSDQPASPTSSAHSKYQTDSNSI